MNQRTQCGGRGKVCIKTVLMLQSALISVQQKNEVDWDEIRDLGGRVDDFERGVLENETKMILIKRVLKKSEG